MQTPFARTLPCRKGGQHPPGLQQAENCQQVEGGDSFPLLSTGETQVGAGPSAGLTSARETGTDCIKSSDQPQS